MKNLFKYLAGVLVFCLPIFAMDAEGGMMAAMGMGLFVFVIIILVTIFFLLSQSAFAKSMKTSDESKNTSAVWIWTQLIPVWSLIAIPVTLIKLNEQYKVFISENNLEGNTSIEQYNNTWGWVWFFGNLVSIFLPIAGLVAIIGVIGFWIHINKVKNSLAGVNA